MFQSIRDFKTRYLVTISNISTPKETLKRGANDATKLDATCYKVGLV